MGEEDAAAEEYVGWAAGEALDALDEVSAESLAAELLDELVVVNLIAILGRHLPRVHHLRILLSSAGDLLFRHWRCFQLCKARVLGRKVKLGLGFGR